LHVEEGLGQTNDDLQDVVAVAGAAIAAAATKKIDSKVL
jgi:hypothetical protein